jgi:hypothetical protein
VVRRTLIGSRSSWTTCRLGFDAGADLACAAGGGVGSFSEWFRLASGCLGPAAALEGGLTAGAGPGVVRRVAAVDGGRAGAEGCACDGGFERVEDRRGLLAMGYSLECFEEEIVKKQDDGNEVFARVRRTVACRDHGDARSSSTSFS